MLGFTSKDIKLQDEKKVYSGFHKLHEIILQHRLFAGGWSPPIKRELVKREPAVAVLLYDAKQDVVVLVEQFRVGAMHHKSGAWQLELVAGMMETNQTQTQVAVRETQEEAGVNLTESSLVKIYDYLASSGWTSESMTIYYAPVDAHQATGIHGLPEEGEDIRVRVMPRTQAWQQIELGNIANASTIIGLQWLQLNYAKLSS